MTINLLDNGNFERTPILVDGEWELQQGSPSDVARVALVPGAATEPTSYSCILSAQPSTVVEISQDRLVFGETYVAEGWVRYSGETTVLEVLENDNALYSLSFPADTETTWFYIDPITFKSNGSRFSLKITNGAEVGSGWFDLFSVSKYVPDEGNIDQQGDVLIYQSRDGAEMNVENGVIEMTAGLETMFYLTILGGNQDDDGSEATKSKSWWGNEGELPENQYRSRFNALLFGLAVNSASIRKLQDALENDIKDAFVSTGIAKDYDFLFSIVNPKFYKIDGQLTLSDDTIVPLTIIERFPGK